MRAGLRTVRLELTEPLRISRSTMAARDAVWFSLEHQGLRGHGEIVSSVYYRLDTDTICRMLRQVMVDIRRFATPESALEALREGAPPLAEVPPAVTAGVESALLDLVGLRADVPVHQLVGAVRTPRVQTARTLGISGVAEATAQATRLVDAGFRVLKLKAGSRDPREDLDRVRAVRDAAPDARLLLDPNGAWSVEEAPRLLESYARLGVEAVEQPLAAGTPEALAALAADSPLPIIADEDAASLEDVRRLAGRVHGVNIKLAKCGGVHQALRIAELATQAGTDLMLGCLTASTLGLAPAVHLADRARWADLDGHLLLAHDPWEGIGGRNGTVGVSAKPGLGVRPRRRELDQGPSGERG